MCSRLDSNRPRSEFHQGSTLGYRRGSSHCPCSLSSNWESWGHHRRHRYRKLDRCSRWSRATRSSPVLRRNRPGSQVPRNRPWWSRTGSSRSCPADSWPDRQRSGSCASSFSFSSFCPSWPRLVPQAAAIRQGRSRSRAGHTPSRVSGRERPGECIEVKSIHRGLLMAITTRRSDADDQHYFRPGPVAARGIAATGADSVPPASRAPLTSRSRARRHTETRTRPQIR